MEKSDQKFVEYLTSPFDYLEGYPVKPLPIHLIVQVCPVDPLFAERVKKAKTDFLNFILKTKNDGKTIVANSCPGRCVTLLNYYGIDSDLIPYITEQPTSLKLGMFLPGMHIPIIKNEILLKEQPDFVVLLAWHYAEPIMKELRSRGLKSAFVIPLPDLTVVKT